MLFRSLTSSLGSTESLIVTAQIMAARDLTPEQQKISALTPGTIRLSIGLEDQEDLIEDLDRALTAALG